MTRGNTVLLVGGSQTGNAIRQLALEEAGYSVVPVLNAAAAAAEARSRDFDIGVVDGYFEPENVREALVALRSLAIPTLLIAPRWTPEETKRLAHLHIPLQDASWMTSLVSSILLCPEAKGPSTVPIGFGTERVRLGEHAAWLCANEEHVAQTLRFLEAGFEEGDRAIIAGDAPEHERLTRMLAAHGFDVRALVASDKLQLLDVHNMIAPGDAWVDKVREMITSARCMVRILGCGSLRAPWPSDEAFFRYEEQVDAVIENTRSVVVCVYELSAVSGKQLWYGGLGKHGTVITPEGMRQNQRIIASHPAL